MCLCACGVVTNDRRKRTEGAILLCVANVLVSVRSKRQLCVHSCNSSVETTIMYIIASVYACAHASVKCKFCAFVLGGLNDEMKMETQIQSEKHK